MRLFKTGLVLALTGLLAGCQTLYQPEDDDTGLPHGGYRETYVNANTTIVSFTGNNFTPQNTIEAYLLYRCARITMEHGYTYFIVTSTSASAANIEISPSQQTKAINNPPRLYTSVYVNNRYRSFRATPTKMPPYVATVDTRGDPYPHSAVAVIEMFSGRIPSNLPNAYEANDVIAHLGTTAFRD